MPFAEKPHILIIDDDARIRTLVSKYLWQNDFIAAMAGSAEEGVLILKDFEFDALVVDIMMPGDSGLEFTRKLRAAHNNVPVILLTALGDIENRIEGFEQGADDYLPKPFEPRELVLRLKALLKRQPKASIMTLPTIIGEWQMDAERAILEHHSDPARHIRLTDLETKLLAALLSRHNEVISREDLARMCDMESSERAIDVQVTRLRKKLEDDPANPRYLRTVRGKGYMLRTA